MCIEKPDEEPFSEVKLARNCGAECILQKNSASWLRRDAFDHIVSAICMFMNIPAHAWV